MKFYLCHTPEGRQRLVTRQDEAKKLDKNAEPIDIPVDQAGIKAGYEELFDKIFDLEQQIGGRAPTVAPEQEPSDGDAVISAEPAVYSAPERHSSWTALEIEEFILGPATIPQCENIFQCLGTRFAEFAKREANNG